MPDGLVRVFSHRFGSELLLKWYPKKRSASIAKRKPAGIVLVIPPLPVSLAICFSPPHLPRSFHLLSPRGF